MKAVRAPWASAFAGLVALAVAIGIGRFAFTPILPMMQGDWGLTVAEAGWLASANYAGYLAGAFTAIGARVRASLAIRGGLLVIGVSTLAMGLDHAFLSWLALRFIAGAASAWVLIFVSTWALERLAAHPGLSGVVYAGVGAGIVVAGSGCSVVMALDAGSATAWLALGGVSLCATALIWTLVKDPS